MDNGNNCPLCGQYTPAYGFKMEHDGDMVTIKWRCECSNCNRKFAFYEWFEKRGEEIELEEN